MNGALPIGVSMGDPAGIGPEIIVKAWQARTAASPVFFAIGDIGVFARTFERLGIEPAVSAISSCTLANAAFAEGLPVLSRPLAVHERLGKPDGQNAPAIIEAIRIGTELALRGESAGLVTAPIAKSVLYEAGFTFPGHTEFVADLTKAAPGPSPRGPVMMLAGASLRVSLVSIHTPLRRAIETLTSNEIVRVARVTDAALRRDFGIDSPRIALAGINPHAGEGGSLGNEEIEIINPAAARLREAGVNATDAQPPDSLFHAEARADYDAVVAMYHDQGLIPLKTLHFWDGVNITLGLPIIRTSPDHGTGFNIAGKNLARADSMIAALVLAQDFAKRRAATA